MAAGGGHGERGGEDLKAGDELLLSYGPRLAEELLHVYGFLPEPIYGNGQGTNRRTVAAVAESADQTWDAAVLLVPCDTSEDGEEEIELFGTPILGRDPRLPSQQGWELIKVSDNALENVPCVLRSCCYLSCASGMLTLGFGLHASIA